MIPKTLTDVISLVKDKLTELNSPLSTFSQYSNFYAIVRSIGHIVTEQDVLLSNTIDNLYIKTAEGSDLDRLARDYSLYRLSGNVSSGYVLVKGKTTTIPKGTILSSPQRGYEYELTNSITINENIEVVGSIQGFTRSEEANLSGGTKLYSPIFPTTEFTIGKRRQPATNLATPGLSGGSLEETDDEFRFRILETIRGRDTGTIGAIRRALSILPYINRLYIVEHKPVTGYFTVYTNISDNEKIEDIKDVIERVKPAGIAYQVKPINTTTIDIRLSIKVSNLSSSSNISTNVKSSINRLSNSLSIGESLTLNKLIGVTMNHPDIESIDVLNPLQDIKPSDNSVIEITNVNINFYS